ncbi:MAG: hypothetical protein R2856_32305 [Caldilineaceae bacterium]
MAELVNSSVMLAGENTTEVYGDQGVIIQNHDDVPSTNGPRGTTPSRPNSGVVANQIGKISRSPSRPIYGERIQGVPCSSWTMSSSSTPLTATAEDGRVAVEMILAAYQSAREGKRGLNWGWMMGMMG